MTMETNAGVPGVPYWKCSECGFTVQEQAPPDTCPSCKEQCEFKDVTCYTPECGFKGVDPKL
jgi:rubrerythrin